jgi:hypothetical protein
MKSKRIFIILIKMNYFRYEWLFFSVTYICPIIILTITYTRIAIELWGQTGLFNKSKEEKCFFFHDIFQRLEKLQNANEIQFNLNEKLLKCL